MSNKYNFGSRYIVDVQINDKYIALIDSGRGIQYIDKSDTEVCKQFKYWLENVFFKGIPNFLTVIKYEIINNEENHTSDKIIKKFVNINCENNII